MAIVMQANGDPAAGMANTIAFAGLAALAFALAWLFHRPLVAGGGRVVENLAVSAPSFLETANPPVPPTVVTSMSSVRG
jgi:hypothetical protein